MANEKRLIDANELIRIVREQADKDPVAYPIVSATLNAVANLADGLTIVDAVEVVRCKDCKHRYIASSGVIFCQQHLTMSANDDDFCSYGERKDNG